MAEQKMKCFCGADMIPAGRGKYPYDCIAKDKYPNAMVYKGCTNGHTCWTSEVPKTIKPDYPQLKGFTDIEGILCLSVLIAGNKIRYDSNIEQVAYYHKNIINYDCDNCDLKNKCLACIINE